MKRLLLAMVMVIGGATLAHAQAVQLPTFNQFGVQTTVSVPDRGGMILGGVDRAASGSTERGFGPFRNRAAGSSVSSSRASVHATIIDLREMDEALLAQGRAERVVSATPAEVKRTDPIAEKARFLSRYVAKAPATASATPTTRSASQPVAKKTR